MAILEIPPALAAYPQFVLWIARPSSRPGKTDKFPIHPQTGQIANAHDPANWLTAAQAQAALAAGVPQASGIGFVFTENDPFFFLDIDGALVDNQWSPVATALCQQLAGCFVEISQSGTGLHIIGSYPQPAPQHGTRCQPHGLELYTRARFVALTGTSAVGDPGHTVNLQPVIDQYFPPSQAATNPVEWTDTPDPEWSGPEDDDELLQRMLASRPGAGSLFGDRIPVQELWAGNHAGDHSAADSSLCAHLAFWTGRDCERMDRLFRLSGLMREKWADRPDYRQRTILHATAHCERVLTARPVSVDQSPPEPADELTGLRGGYQLMSVPSQIPYFKGCTYIRSLHRIMVPDGELLSQDRFNATMGGYNFAIDVTGEKTTRKAWDVFTESGGFNFPKAHEACFRPEVAPGAMIEEEGRVLVNTYTPVVTTSTPGDASPFLSHVSKLIPDLTDRAILLAYLAALVQHPGVKFQWCPIIQGVQGNGKTLLTTALANAIGSRYTHIPNPEDISNKFNSWILGKLLIIVEEVYVADRRELVNVLKPLVTNRRVDIQGKGQDQKTGDNRANFLMTTNHKDAVPVTDDDRRYAVFFAAQQHRGDLDRDGMGGTYFPDLYRWADNGGYAIINHYLRSYPIPDALNPATSCQRAPRTSSTPEAIHASLGSIEQEVLEAVEEGRPGFSGGWISSLAFDRLLEERRASKQIPVNRRREVLRSLGYDWHPALRDGRVNNHIMDVGGLAGKPKLYVRSGHLALNVTVAADIVRHYLEAQAGSTGAAVVFAPPVDKSSLTV